VRRGAFDKLLEGCVEDLNVDQRRFGDDSPVGLQHLRASERRDHDVAERLMRPRIVGDSRSKQVVVHPSLQGPFVEIEDLL